MSGNVSPVERAAFRMAYEFYEQHFDPPANQDENAVAWWTQVALDSSAIYNEWKSKCELGKILLFAMMEYLELKAKAATSEKSAFIQEGQ